MATNPERMGMGMDTGRERGPRDSIAGRAGRSNGHGRGHGHKDRKPAPPPLLKAGKKREDREGRLPTQI